MATSRSWGRPACWQPAGDLPIPEAGEVSSAECIGDLDQRSSTFTAVGTIFGFNGRIGSVGYPPGADFRGFRSWWTLVVGAGQTYRFDSRGNFPPKSIGVRYRLGGGLRPPHPPLTSFWGRARPTNSNFHPKACAKKCSGAAHEPALPLLSLPIPTDKSLTLVTKPVTKVRHELVRKKCRSRRLERFHRPNA